MLLDFAAQIAPILDAIIIVLAVVLIYLLATRVFTSKILPKEEQLETMEMIREEKLKQIKELTLENQTLEETVKRAKQKYMKRKIDASTYKKIVEDSQEKIIQNEAKMKILSR